MSEVCRRQWICRRWICSEDYLSPDGKPERTGSRTINSRRNAGDRTICQARSRQAHRQRRQRLNEVKSRSHRLIRRESDGASRSGAATRHAPTSKRRARSSSLRQGNLRSGREARTASSWASYSGGSTCHRTCTRACVTDRQRGWGLDVRKSRGYALVGAERHRASRLGSAARSAPTGETFVRGWCRGQRDLRATGIAGRTSLATANASGIAGNAPTAGACNCQLN